MPQTKPLLATEISLYYTSEHLNQLREVLCLVNHRKMVAPIRV
jgi:hypothetical protein